MPWAGGRTVHHDAEVTQWKQRARKLGVESRDVLRDSAREFAADRCRRLGAGLAYYALFAVVPTLLLTAVIAAAFVGQEAVEGELAEQLEDFVGSDGADAIQDAIAGLWENTDTSSFAVISVLILVYSSSVLFVAWRDSLEIVWDVPYEADLFTSLRTRAFAALVPIAAGLLFAAILLLEMAIGFIEQLVDSALLDTTLQAAGSIVPSVVGFFGLGLLYRHSARSRRPDWHDVWPATIVTWILLAIASWGFGLYMNVVGTTSVSGAASGVLVGLVVVYYMAQIVLFGAEIIKVISTRNGDTDETAQSAP